MTDVRDEQPSNISIGITVNLSGMVRDCKLLQKAKKYTVSIFKYEKDLLGEKVKMSQNGLFYYADDSVYSKERGLMIDGKNLENAGTIFG